jgi:sortase A
MLFARRVERLLLIAGLSLGAVPIAAHIHSALLCRAELRHFRNLQLQRSVQRPTSLSAIEQPTTDFSLWSEQRIAAYADSLSQHLAPPLAVLRISKVNLEVPVLKGTDDLVLNRGVGHIPGTVLPGEEGNIGIAGHRDGFFRVLKDVGPGDTIELETEDRTDTYRVNQIVIVKPDDVTVLRPRSVPSLTLVTCYPFYFIGSAPQRYIVEASITNGIPRNRQVFPGSEDGSIERQTARSVRLDQHYVTQVHDRESQSRR